ncbi:MAG: hypothetical protein GEEBNDBF_01277 [bacterium]|nr:hypothetical protein [bacterium]
MNATYGQAIVGDTRQGDLCRARVFVSDDVIAEVTIDLISEEPMDRTVAVFLDYLKGRPYAEVLQAVTARSCSSDGCSSVEGKCFSLLQEAVYRALGDWASRHGNARSAVLSTPAGGVDLLRRRNPAPLPDVVDLAEAVEWAASRIRRDDDD